MGYLQGLGPCAIGIPQTNERGGQRINQTEIINNNKSIIISIIL